MLNVTFSYLQILSMTFQSPFFMIGRQMERQSPTFVNCHFNNFIQTVIYSNTNMHSTILKSTQFTHLLNTPVKMVKDEICSFGEIGDKYKYNLKNLYITTDNFTDSDDHRAYYVSECGSLLIVGCTFSECYSNNGLGGSLLVSDDINVKIHSTIFDKSTTGSNRGAGVAITRNFDQKSEVGYDQRIPQLDVQYCCFQDCYSKGSENELYGVALFSAAENTTLLYTSTNNCPGSHGRSKGAQFDLQANIISSKYLNATGGNALFCSAIEYRHATEGYFMYQTTFNNTGKFSTCFTNISIMNINLNYSNYISNYIIDSSHGSTSSPSLVHIKLRNAIIDSFFFFKNKRENGNGAIVSKGSYDVDVNIYLYGCYTDGDESWIIKEENYHTNDLKFEASYTAYPISLLKLGNCQGEVPPEDFYATKVFSDSKAFTKSDEFTKSNDFSKSESFSDTIKMKTYNSYVESIAKIPETETIKKDLISETETTYLESSEKKDLISETETIYSESSEKEDLIGETETTYSESSEKEAFIDDNQDEKSKGPNVKMIGAIAGSAAAVIIIIIVVTVLLIRKRRKESSTNDVDVLQNKSTSVTTTNTVNGIMDKDDPFAEDFKADDQKGTVI